MSLLFQGTEVANQKAQQTLEEVRKAMGIDYT
jgi:hypothetical protein